MACCDGTLAGCKECPNYNNHYRCKIETDALALIKSQELTIFALENRLKECENGYEGTLALERAKVKELTEENERLIAQVNRLKKYDEERDIALHARLIANTRTDTVREMQERFAMHFGTYTEQDEIKVADVFRSLRKFAKEMLEGFKCH